MSRQKVGSRPTGRSVQSVDRAVAIVDALAGTKEGMSLTKLAASLDLAPQTLQSLLRTLQQHGWVVQPHKRGPYRLRPGLGELQRRWVAGQDRIALAKPIVTELCNRVGEYIILAEWTGSGLMPLLEAQPDQELTVRRQMYVPERIHSMATGKLLLASLDETRRQEIVAALPLPPNGPNSVTDPKALLKQLSTIRRDGVAVCVEEAVVGLAALAVPVSGRPAQTPVALGTALPMARFSPGRRDKLIAELRSAAATITETWT